MVSVTPREMIRAFNHNVAYIRNHHRHSQRVPHTRSSRLIMIYAVECGAQALLMRRHNIKCTADLRSTEHWPGHDVDLALGRLGRVPSNCRPLKSMGVKDHRLDLHVPEYHEAWRYGLYFLDEHEEVTEASLKRAIDWLEQEIAKEIEAS